MKDRILEFLKTENKSSAQLSEEIGVQPSSISHIISGRNNPSLDFILKMLGRYPDLSTDWLLFGKGSMYRGKVISDLFNIATKEVEGKVVAINNEEANSDQAMLNIREERSKELEMEKRLPVPERIVYFYSDKHFVEYFPNVEKQNG